MLELGTSGSVRGVHGDMHPYRDPWICSELQFLHTLFRGNDGQRKQAIRNTL